MNEEQKKKEEQSKILEELHMAIGEVKFSIRFIEDMSTKGQTYQLEQVVNRLVKVRNYIHEQ